MDKQQKSKVSPIALFYSYAHEDKPLREQLEKHLCMLNRQDLISEWHDRQIVAGTDWPLRSNGYCCLIQKVGRETQKMGCFTPINGECKLPLILKRKRQSLQSRIKQQYQQRN